MIMGVPIYVSTHGNGFRCIVKVENCYLNIFNIGAYGMKHLNLVYNLKCGKETILNLFTWLFRWTSYAP